ncbi:MAG TPA: protein-methionine-sulfoxide reductase catalytic subunit MsrP [Gammaproteobacteria bacterium]|jgi:sulfoxide reductase catalytic subunit YedY|nr:protein-methionine-sulfoxide reductase catalytic subunit MsrP [Gammaproteobacteria bacterium]HIL62723.1 protein-methionine-sulfoxide reductase catalytic subunit MsrP [Porticoccaceae bacterium]HAT25920.1 protein-methionine-sulfoxide reductase catalytic subunit MsrP [Gammaproteobacteria bacterium]HIA59151.1 protein-methionine-sulfoxide reductase catalytic subunit MsrP [Gammaproteobacteria bacterium]HIF86758.1 protein-methionine-sulfoxide reductase catalytic subunit MsrP [Gammaproteobacteria ba|tara:strand:+ start:13857 stop:14900 length:1044 start_codon:yes stop_codon:yes gene_type:complete
MLIKKPADIKPSEITPEVVYRNRREFMAAGSRLMLGAAVAGALPSIANAQNGDRLKARAPATMSRSAPAPWWAEKFSDIKPAPDSAPFYTGETLTPYRDVTRYNNFYEFGMDKSDPSSNSGKFKADPWSVEISGEVAKPGTYHLEDILKPQALEERIYRLRCVEAWSMVIPWIGFPLANLIKRFEPTSKAKYIEFETLVDRDIMPGIRSRFAIVDWPYREGLRMDEAMNPLTLMAVGLYGNYLPPQNGAPMRLIVPWKYGFKSIKSIIRINFRETKPHTTWNDLQANEYGFYANVNPAVHHPRWRQDKERRLPQTLFSRQYMDTRLFNGYGDQVASMYEGLDLARNF